MRPEDVELAAARLISMLDDDVEAVRFAAQSALLHGAGHVNDELASFLTTSDSPGVVWALEVAANSPDPRLLPGIRRHLASQDARRRAIATRACAPWMDDPGELIALLDDRDPSVRAVAAEAAGLIGAQTLAARVGKLLSDRSWVVREHAGRALATMGPAGVMTLRIHLNDDDAYAQDMARQVLDTIGDISAAPVRAA